jgi:tetratricopeptide (TPR) repeat protein
MKAERRRELKVNSLVWHLQGLPQTIKKYQSQILLVLTLIALVIILINNRIRAARERIESARQSVSIAGEDLQQLKNRLIPAPGADLSNLMKAREDAFSEGLQQVELALQKAPESEAALRAQALLYKGDLNFQMANFPVLPGADTQPSLRPVESEDDLLNNATDAYNQVIQHYPNDQFSTTAAHFGLAAIAENRAAAGDTSQWYTASSEYQAILDSAAEKAFTDMAQDRLKLLAQLRQPIVFDLPPPTNSPSSQPTTTPSKK